MHFAPYHHTYEWIAQYIKRWVQYLVNININVRFIAFYWWTIVTRFSYINVLIKLHWFFFLVFAKKSLIVLIIKNSQNSIFYWKIYSLWVFFQRGNTEYKYFNLISIIATTLFLIAQSKLKYPLFLKYQQVIGTNGKIYKSVWALFLYLQVSLLKQLVYVWIGQSTGWEIFTRYWLRS